MGRPALVLGIGHLLSVEKSGLDCLLAKTARRAGRDSQFLGDATDLVSVTEQDGGGMQARVLQRLPRPAGSAALSLAFSSVGIGLRPMTTIGVMPRRAAACAAQLKKPRSPVKVLPNVISANGASSGMASNHAGAGVMGRVGSPPTN